MEKIKQIGVVCYGNIVRSQILGIYLKRFLKEANSNIKVYSIGTAPYEAYSDTFVRIKEVMERLRERGIKKIPKRNYWTEKGGQELAESDIIVVADNNGKKELFEKLNTNAEIYLFYEFIDEKEKDFEDTYDYEKRCQDPIKFEKCFDELERMAKKMVNKLIQMKIQKNQS